MPKMKVKSIERNNETNEKEATMMVSNEAVLFLRDAVNMYIQRGFGDKDDAKQNKISQEVKQDLHDAWKLLNPS